MVVVAAFGQILPKAIIDFPPLGCLNIHPSLLPKYRGAAPLNWSIIRGETKTGVTIMLMDEGMDSGDILTQEETPLEATETYGELHDRLAKLGATLLLKTIEQVVAGTAQRQPQDAAGVTFAPRLTKETGKINWHDSVFNIVNLIRGLSPTPAAYTSLDGQASENFYRCRSTGPSRPATRHNRRCRRRRPTRCGIRRLCHFKRRPAGRKEKNADWRFSARLSSATGEYFGIAIMNDALY